ncbi:alpha/beta hydrolase [Leptospira fletcheri]|uniref:Alpha/beta hydrolase n=1 Tax=Leptospira fletcheri TaxID=2484981 RepID=A0A4R9GK28_9LEPT|nr:alpha/beta hydrolase [Leptospira fletcheri]TGK13126.1 alpha/beta hydrolase [Leptospira fletcheri]
MTKFYYRIIYFFKRLPCFLPILMFGCTSLYYHPTKLEYFTPDKFGFKAESSFLNAKDGVKLHLWKIHSQNSDAPKSPRGIILQFHGNGENMSTHFISLVWLVNYGYELYTYDYRGYGASGGKPDPESLYEDSLLVLEQVHSYARSIDRKLIVYGQSLGGAVALRAVPDMKTKDHLSLVVADGTFSSYRDVAVQTGNKILFPPMGYLLGPFFSDTMSPKNFISKISPIPLLVVHGTEDPVVPFSNGKEVFRLAAEPKLFWEIRGGGHVDWMQLGRSEGAKNFVKLLNQFLSPPE